MKKKAKQRMGILLVLFLFLLVCGGIVISAFYLYPKNSLDYVEQDTSTDLNLDMYPKVFCQGSQVTGTITSNMPYATCNSYYNAGLGWNQLQSFQLNSQGYYSNTQVINVVGSSNIRVICCLLDGSCKISNVETITSQTCQTTTNPQTTTTLHYTCIDSDGLDFDTFGHCQDGYHQMDYQESCFNGQVKEYYCDDMGICQVIYGGTCSNDALPCGVMLYPTGQTQCSQYSCQTGTCLYIPPTSATASRCECQ